MFRAIILVVTLVGFNAEQSKQVENPISPCPDVFRYNKTEPGMWEGALKLVTDSTLHALKLEIVLDGKADLLKNWVGEVTTKDNTEFQIKNSSVKIYPDPLYTMRLVVQYNALKEPPRILIVRLNDREICSSSISVQRPNTNYNVKDQLPTHNPNYNNELPTHNTNYNNEPPTHNTNYGNGPPKHNTHYDNDRTRPPNYNDNQPSDQGYNDHNYYNWPRPKTNTGDDKNQGSNTNNNNNQPTNTNYDYNSQRPPNPDYNTNYNKNNLPSYGSHYNNNNNQPPFYNTNNNNNGKRPPNFNTNYDSNNNPPPSYNTHYNENNRSPSYDTYYNNRVPNDNTNYNNNNRHHSQTPTESSHNYFTGGLPTFVVPVNQNNNNEHSSDQCGKVLRNFIPLVVNGQPTLEGQWPWQVALYQVQDSVDHKYICGGTLVSHSHVITAAHCVALRGSSKEVDKSTLTVYLGKHNLRTSTDGVETRFVSNIKIHHHYNASCYSRDVAILTLHKPVQYTDLIRSACLWPEQQVDLENVVGRVGSVVGWGFDGKGKPTAELTLVEMPVVDQNTCVRSYTAQVFFLKYTSDYTYCAGYRDGTSVCNGDSGNGMVFNSDNTWYLRGLVSLAVVKQNEFLCDPSQYVVFTDLAKFSTWIKQNIVELF